VFTGIIECTTTPTAVEMVGESIALTLRRPKDFNDLQVGHSVAVNGVCLTVEAFDEATMRFTLGVETLRVTGWTSDYLKSLDFNVERAMLVGSRIHGHWVTGHVDGLGELVRRKMAGECLLLSVRVPESIRHFVWPKGSVAINGVSLTVNEVNGGDTVEVCLIPETLRRTHLANLKVGDRICVEGDYLAKAVARQRETNSWGAVQP
jgi:riboflavin synthase